MREKVTASWRHYLGAGAATPYAAPARAQDVAGLPPAYIARAEFDPNRDEAIEYGQRLLHADVPVELHQWPGTFHGSLAVFSADISQLQIARADDLAAEAASTVDYLREIDAGRESGADFGSELDALVALQESPRSYSPASAAIDRLRE